MLAEGVIERELKKFELSLEISKSFGTSINISEFKLLEVFLMRPGQVFNREQLLDKVWGNQIYVEERTVDVHVGRLRRALNRGKVKKDPIRTVRSAGYSLNENYS